MLRQSRRAAWGTRTVFKRVDDRKGHKVGAVIHEIGTTTVLTLAVYPRSGRVIQVSSRVECTRANPFTWSYAVHLVNGHLIDVDRTATMPSPCVPSWAEFAVASYLAEHSGHPAIDCWVIDEPTGQPYASRFAWSSGDELTWSVEGGVRVRHAVRGQEIVRSEWGELTSVVVRDEDELLAGIAPEIRYSVVDFVNDAARR
ncbi:hypothetical protein SAMN05443377_102161 [Propionibacterium cyclohexanicum]|uniref:Uncharacterized protein n=1 Tax=Propionibacterium cyclohexanicum TaxID=64702 RepID=A0A1H9Q6B8_9ACTN|nr:hypothetical protein [Propionibacterium cyclohexanicum]SER56106.1 hypothetical protein SAMN05443377_102161 [Propionibacterium cyclohexanicum]